MVTKIKDLEDTFNSVREAYMKRVLERELRNEDIILAHPGHIDAIISH